MPQVGVQRLLLTLPAFPGASKIPSIVGVYDICSDCVNTLGFLSTSEFFGSLQLKEVYVTATQKQIQYIFSDLVDFSLYLNQRPHNSKRGGPPVSGSQEIQLPLRFPTCVDKKLLLHINPSCCAWEISRMLTPGPGRASSGACDPSYMGPP